MSESGRTNLRVRILGSCLLILLAVWASLWLYGLLAPPPLFVLGPPDSGIIRALERPSWQQTAVALHHRQYAMLTFDDGPADHETNMKILATLQRHRAPAAFFCLCRNAQLPWQISDLKLIADSGHVIANHTYNHPRLPGLDPETQKAEIIGCRDALRALSGQPVHWFRPPHGLVNQDIKTLLVQNEQQLVMWSANSGDTWLSDPEAIINLATSEAKNGSILLLHSSPFVAGILDSILTRLEQKGFQFVLAEDRPLPAQRAFAGGPGDQ